MDGRGRNNFASDEGSGGSVVWKVNSKMRSGVDGLFRFEAGFCLRGVLCGFRGWGCRTVGETAG
jgi:hypothetical protein